MFFVFFFAMCTVLQ